MNTVTSAGGSYYAANTNEKTEKGPCMFGHDAVRVIGWGVVSLKTTIKIL